MNNNTVSSILALHMVNLDSIPSSTDGSLNPPGVIPECRAKIKPRALPDVAQKMKKKIKNQRGIVFSIDSAIKCTIYHCSDHLKLRVCPGAAPGGPRKRSKTRSKIRGYFSLTAGIDLGSLRSTKQVPGTSKGLTAIHTDPSYNCHHATGPACFPSNLCRNT